MADLADLSCTILDRELNKFDVGSRVRLYDLQSDSEAFISPSGAQETAELIRLIGGNFESGSLPTVTWLTNVTDSGVVTTAIGELTLTTGTTADSIAEVQSVNRAEFTTATLNKAHLAFQMLDFAQPNLIREFGMFDPITPIISGDGVFFRNISGVFTLVRRKAGADVENVSISAFNGGNAFEQNNDINIFELVYNAGAIDFYQNRKILHRMRSLDAVAYETTHLTLGARIENINGNTTDNMLKTRGFSCSRISASSAQPDSITINAATSGLLKNSPGQLDSVIINDTGVAGATLDLYDNVAIVGVPIVSLSLTSGLVGLMYDRRLNTGLFFDTSGSNFEVVVNWR